MGPLKNDITGQTFNYLTAIKRVQNKGSSVMFLFKCVCGKKKEMSAKKVRYGLHKSCGCMKNELCRIDKTIHGHAIRKSYNGRSSKSQSPTYKTFHNMHERCYKHNNKEYHNYGGRGIKVCKRWKGKNGFLNFLKDMGERPEGYEIDRYPNNDGDYEPSNCRWATRQQNSNNTRKSIYLVYKNKKLTLVDWSYKLSINHSALDRRIRLKWSVKRIIETPLYRKKRVKFYFHPHLIRLRSICSS